MIDVVMPKLGESITEGTILEWKKKVGDTVDLDENLLEISTDKVDSEVPSPAGGIVAELLYSINDIVEVGNVIARIASDKDDIKIESENILIGAKRATPIGLIVNELITNSLKYAFPEGQKGDIMISLEQTKNQFKLVYSDNGVGIPKDLGTCFIIKFKSNKEPIGLIS